MTHRLDASADNAHWGYFDATLAPRLTVKSGERVTISTVSAAPDQLPDASWGIPPALPAIHAKFGGPTLPGHICTGPVAVEGAKAGSVLQVDIEAIDLHYDWGYTLVRPLAGALPDDVKALRLFHSRIDRASKIATMPWGHEIPLDRPFFGVMAVAPPKEWGRVNTLPPRRNGGNLDNKELVAGTTLYLPVFVDGANFSVGDAHGAQGDGEVCITAIETGLIGTFKLTVRDDMSLVWPMAETPTEVITMAFDPDLDAAVQIALRSMIDLVVEKSGLDRDEAYALMSLVADLRVTQVVNGNKGIHVVLDKKWLKKIR
ncbi:amidase [Phreatobacter aquaticus]|uniref:Amidase n=1 Tax=Phreatobacter aquaticus TaxID=2570229 RepID=A0A4D7QTF5_9HYPH|nr:acetamidase/formamidase family protein [Phreatobacter aquaticus]QCK88494.1 amidase [Phreatobacter aquaticus]